MRLSALTKIQDIKSFQPIRQCFLDLARAAVGCGSPFHNGAIAKITQTILAGQQVSLYRVIRGYHVYVV